MDPLRKFSYQIFCINFCESNTARKLLLLFHVANSVATIAYLNLNGDQTFRIPLTKADTSSVALRVWFFCYICVYCIVYVEGFFKDSKFNRQYHQLIEGFCERHQKTGRDYYTAIILAMLLSDLVYLILSLFPNFGYQSLHSLCLIPRVTIRVRLWSYLYICRGVLKELEGIIERVENIPENATREEFLRTQQEYSDLWRVSQIVGDFHVLSLCCSVFHIVLDIVVYSFWLLTVEFANNILFYCKLHQLFCVGEFLELFPFPQITSFALYKVLSSVSP